MKTRCITYGLRMSWTNPLEALVWVTSIEDFWATNDCHRISKFLLTNRIFWHSYIFISILLWVVRFFFGWIYFGDISVYKIQIKIRLLLTSKLFKNFKVWRKISLPSTKILNLFFTSLGEATTAYTSLDSMLFSEHRATTILMSAVLFCFVFLFTALTSRTGKRKPEKVERRKRDWLANPQKL